MVGLEFNDSGDWKDFKILMIEAEDYPLILEHLEANFYQDELIFFGMGDSKEATLSFNKTALEHLAHNLSICAVHKGTGKIAGVRIIFESVQNEYSSNPAFTVRKSGWSGDNSKHHFLTELEDKCNIFQMYGSDTRCAQFHLTSVDREFRGQGLGTEMYRRSLDYLKKLGFTMAKGCFSNKESIHIATKLNFKELARSYMKEFKDEKGILLFPNSEPDHFCALMALKL